MKILSDKFMIAVVKILIPATILLIPAYLIRFTIFGIPTNVLEILVLASLGLLVFGRTNRTDKTDRAYVVVIFLILAGLLISTLINGNYKMGFGIIKGWFIVPLVFFWVLIKEIKKKEDLESILKWLYFSIFLVAAISLVYYFSGSLTYDGRLKAIYLSPNHLAMYLAPAIFIGLWMAQGAKISAKGGSASGGKNQNEKLKNYAALSVIMTSLLIILSSLYLTYSYAAWLAVIVSFIIVSAILCRNKINKKLLVTGLLVIFLLVISQWNTAKSNNLKNFSQSSLESRIIIWQAAGKILKDNLIFGIGPGNFQNKYLEYQKYFPPYLEWAVPQPHNLYLAFWLQAGIMGIAGFIILIFKWLEGIIMLVKKQKNGADVAAVLLGIMLYILLHGLADTTYWKNDLAMVFWVIFSLGLMMKKLDADAV